MKIQIHVPSSFVFVFALVIGLALIVSRLT